MHGEGSGEAVKRKCVICLAVDRTGLQWVAHPSWCQKCYDAWLSASHPEMELTAFVARRARRFDRASQRDPFGKGRK